MSLSAKWVGIIVSGLIGIISLLLTVYFHFKKKASLRISAIAKKVDHNKGKNAAIHPVNELIISIVNESTCPITIKDIVFEYHNKDDQTKFVYDNFSFQKRKLVIKKSLMKSEEMSFSLSYLQDQEKSVIDNLEKVIVISTYGHRYYLKPILLMDAIKIVKNFQLPHPDNLNLDFENNKK